jgi:hypothetical protein
MMNWTLSLQQGLKRTWNGCFSPSPQPAPADPQPELDVLIRLQERVLQSRRNPPLWAQPVGIREDGLFFERQLATLRQAMG